MLASEALSLFFFLLIDGVILGCVYSLVGVGLTIVYGVMDIINFSHGEFYTLGAYLTYWAFKLLGVHPVIAMVLGLTVTLFAGFVTEKVLISPTLKWGHSYAVIVTFVLGILMRNLYLAAFGPTFRAPPQPFLGSVPLLGLMYPQTRIYAACVAVASISVTYIFIRTTMFGKALQAVSQEKEGSMYIGINVGRVNMVGFGISCLLAGIAGLVLTPIYTLVPTAGAILSGKAFAVVALGGLGSVEGSIIAGILLGLTENLGATYIAHDYRDFFSFLIIIGVLIFRPKGLRGRG